MDRKRKLDVDIAAEQLKRPNMNDGGVNPYTGRPYSQRYYDILQKRTGKTLCLFMSTFPSWKFTNNNVLQVCLYGRPKRTLSR